MSTAGRFLEYGDVAALVARGPGEGFLSISLDLPSQRRHEGDFWRSELNSGLRGLAQQYPDDRRLQQTIEAAVQELHGLERDARYRSLVYFRSFDPQWSWWKSLQGSVDTRFTWGRRPAVFPLITYLHREPAIGVLLVSQEEIHSFTWRQSLLDEGEHWKLELDTEDWRTYGAGAYAQPQRAQQTATHDERYRRRWMQAVQREFQSLAPRVEEAAARHRWQALAVFGAAEVREMFVACLSESWRKKVMDTPERRLPTVDLKLLGDAIAQAVAQWRERLDQEELSTLLDNLGAGKGGVVGSQEVLDLLAHGRVYRLYISAGLQASGYRRRDGSMSVVAGLSPLRLRVTKEQAPHYVEEPDFLEEVVALAISRDVEIVPLHGASGERLRQLGGLGAYLR